MKDPQNVITPGFTSKRDVADSTLLVIDRQRFALVYGQRTEELRSGEFLKERS